MVTDRDMKAQMAALTRAIGELTAIMRWQQQQGYTLATLAERYDMHPRTLRRHMQEHGLYDEVGTGRGGGTVRVPLETVRELDRILLYTRGRHAV